MHGARGCSVELGAFVENPEKGIEHCLTITPFLRTRACHSQHHFSPLNILLREDSAASRGATNVPGDTDIATISERGLCRS